MLLDGYHNTGIHTVRAQRRAEGRATSLRRDPEYPRICPDETSVCQESLLRTRRLNLVPVLQEPAVSAASKPNGRNFPLAYLLMGLPGLLTNRATSRREHSP